MRYPNEITKTSSIKHPFIEKSRSIVSQFKCPQNKKPQPIRLCCARERQLLYLCSVPSAASHKPVNTRRLSATMRATPAPPAHLCEFLRLYTAQSVSLTNPQIPSSSACSQHLLSHLTQAATPTHQRPPTNPRTSLYFFSFFETRKRKKYLDFSTTSALQKKI